MKNKNNAIGPSLTRTPIEGKGKEEKTQKLISGRWLAKTRKTPLSKHICKSTEVLPTPIHPSAGIYGRIYLVTEKGCKGEKRKDK